VEDSDDKEEGQEEEFPDTPEVVAAGKLNSLQHILYRVVSARS
jgi:hypothetical protein